jgi:hypothetical protein
MLYLIRPFQRRNGIIELGQVTYSKDRVFASDLALNLVGRKDGVIALGAEVSSDGRIASTAEVIVAHGILPTAAFFPEAPLEAPSWISPTWGLKAVG